MWRWGLAAGVPLLTVLLTPQAAVADGPVSCPLALCGATAVDPGVLGGLPSPSPGGGGPDSGGGSATEISCTTAPFSPQPGAEASWWGGHTAADGQIVRWVCPDGLGVYDARPFFQATGDPAAAAPPPPVDPAVLAQEAYRRIPIDPPGMRLGPDPERVAAKYWTYFWTDNPAPAAVTVTAGTVSVTAQARLLSVTWSPGAPIAADQLDVPAASFTCEGNYVPPADVNISLDPVPGACAFRYMVRSTGERTGGSGAWTVTATALWAIDWTTTSGPEAGRTGSITAPAVSASMPVSVGAWGTVEVYPGASLPTR